MKKFLESVGRPQDKESKQGEKTILRRRSSETLGLTRAAEA